MGRRKKTKSKQSRTFIHRNKSVRSEKNKKKTDKKLNVQRKNSSAELKCVIYMYSLEKMSSPSDDADDFIIIDPLAEELRNIESVISVTSRNIDALNEKFANLQEPPPMYIVEYQELTQR